MPHPAPAPAPSLAFKVDENLPALVTQDLRTAVYDALTVLDQKLGGGADDRLANVCRQENRVLLTLDLDFADIRRYSPQDHAGLIVLRPSRQDVATIQALLARLLPLLQSEPLPGRLWIVDDHTVRIRPAD